MGSVEMRLKEECSPKKGMRTVMRIILYGGELCGKVFPTHFSLCPLSSPLKRIIQIVSKYKSKHITFKYEPFLQIFFYK
jgi:hypothetical protein